MLCCSQQAFRAIAVGACLAVGEGEVGLWGAVLSWLLPCSCEAASGVPNVAAHVCLGVGWGSLTRCGATHARIILLVHWGRGIRQTGRDFVGVGRRRNWLLHSWRLPLRLMGTEGRSWLKNCTTRWAHLLGVFCSTWPYRVMKAPTVALTLTKRRWCCFAFGSRFQSALLASLIFCGVADAHPHHALRS